MNVGKPAINVINKGWGPSKGSSTSNLGANIAKFTGAALAGNPGAMLKAGKPLAQEMTKGFAGETLKLVNDKIAALGANSTQGTAGDAAKDFKTMEGILAKYGNPQAAQIAGQASNIASNQKDSSTPLNKDSLNQITGLLPSEARDNLQPLVSAAESGTATEPGFDSLTPGTSQNSSEAQYLASNDTLDNNDWLGAGATA